MARRFGDSDRRAGESVNPTKKTKEEQRTGRPSGFFQLISGFGGEDAVISAATNFRGKNDADDADPRWLTGALTD